MQLITQFSQLDLTKTYAYEDCLTWQFPEYVELLNGKLLPLMPGRSPVHQTILANLLRALCGYSKQHPEQVWRIPFDVRLAKEPSTSNRDILTVVQPDLFVVCDTTKIDDQGCVGAPDWIVEILSPGFATRDTHTKFDLYEQNGVCEYWVVYPGINTVAAFTLVAGQYQLTAEYTEPGPIPVATLPGLNLEWAEIFEGA
jgi:Uma2 family endonuclease